MHIDVWGINYHPEPLGISVYNTQMCEYLAKKGHKVRATTAYPYYPSWTKTQDGIFDCETIGGITVRRNWLYVPHKTTTLRRILHEGSFATTSFFRQLFSKRPDVYVVVSPPLLLGLCAILISAIKRAPFIFWVQDLQPEAAVTLGMIKQRWLVRLALWIEAVVYKKASFIVAISPEMAAAIESKQVPKSKIRIFPNWISDSGYLTPREPGLFKRKYGISEGSALVSYCGNIGYKQGLEHVVEAAKLLPQDDTIQIVICGDGTQKQRLQEVIDTFNLTNIKLLPVLDSDDYWCLLNDSDICLVTLKSGTGASFLPSKLLNVLALGKPVLTNADAGSALHTAMLAGQFGFATDSTPRSMADAIHQLLKDPAQLKSMGQRGHTYVQQYNKEHILDELIDNLHTIYQPAKQEAALAGKDAI